MKIIFPSLPWRTWRKFRQRNFKFKIQIGIMEYMEKTECTDYPIVSGIPIPKNDPTLDSADSQNSKNTLADNLSILADKLQHDNSATISIFVRDLVSWSG